MSKASVTLITGSNTGVEETEELWVTVEWDSTPAELDVSCFLVGADGKVLSDAYFVFYNQPSDPDGCVQMERAGERAVRFRVRLDQLAKTQIHKCVWAATLDGAGTFAEVAGCVIRAQGAASDIRYPILEATQEKSLVFAELYRHQGRFKLRAVGRGYHGGLKPLAEAHGVEVEDEAPPRDLQAKSAASEVAAASEVHPPLAERQVNLNKIDLLKRKVLISLEKRQIAQQKARVALVFDASGSMYDLYVNGTMQRAFERILAVAASMDDDGELDVWFFADEVLRAPSVQANHYENYVSKVYDEPELWHMIGYGNNEPAVMEDILHKYTVESPDDRLPVFLVFFSDGGIYESGEIARLLIKSSRQNLFWQFVGLGDSDYGVLRELDDLPGRFLDNANFFAFDDLDEVTDEELYDRLFAEFPSWLKQARQQGILRA